MKKTSYRQKKYSSLTLCVVILAVIFGNHPVSVSASSAAASESHTAVFGLSAARSESPEEIPADLFGSLSGKYSYRENGDGDTVPGLEEALGQASGGGGTDDEGHEAGKTAFSEVAFTDADKNAGTFGVQVKTSDEISDNDEFLPDSVRVMVWRGDDRSEYAHIYKAGRKGSGYYAACDVKYHGGLSGTYHACVLLPDGTYAEDTASGAEIGLENYIYYESESQSRITVFITNPVLSDGREADGVLLTAVYSGGEKETLCTATEADGLLVSEITAARDVVDDEYTVTAEAVDDEWIDSYEADSEDDEESSGGDTKERKRIDSTDEIRNVNSSGEGQNLTDNGEISLDQGSVMGDTQDQGSAGKKEIIGAFSCSLTAFLENETEVPEILQNPELPTGCESVALTIDLVSNGFDLEKTTIADDYLIYGSNLADSYVGNPYSSGGAGCFPPCIVKTANKYLRSEGSSLRAKDVSGASLSELLDYIDQGIPVIVWHTMYMAGVQNAAGTGRYRGQTYHWYHPEHCLVMYGYDTEDGTVEISDPLAGKVTRDLDAFEEIYDDAGQYAVVIM